MSMDKEGVTSVANEILSPEEIDAIGEVLNISMGSAATAVSTMLDKQVSITIPHVVVEKFERIDFTSLEPAIIVKIEYVEGISGSNVMVFRQSDMQIILNLLMGNEEPPSEDFVFDELSMSAACEVMNQMMGASATALSSFLGKPINISTPTAQILSAENTFKSAVGVSEEEDIVSVSFNLAIEDIMSSDFISIMTCDLAKSIVNQIMGDQAEEVKALEQAAAAAAAAVAAPAAAPMGAGPGVPPGYPQQPAYPDPAAAYAPPGGGYPPQQPGMPPYGYPGMPPQGAYPEGQMGQPPMGGGYPPYYGQPPYGYPMPPQGYPQNGNVMKQPAVNIQSAQFPSFGMDSPMAPPLTNTNMDLVMNVPLSVSVEIGKTKRKIRDIMDFAQGTVIELEKQAGAPVDIVVNGQLIARGDVVVIDDNFGVRITEILGTKNLVASMGRGNG